MKLFSNLDGIGEKELFGSTRKIISHAQRAVELLDAVIRGSKDFTKMHELKKRSYEEVVRLSNSITSGTISPNLISDMLELLKLEYKIVDIIFVLGRSATRYRIGDAKSRRYLESRLLENNRLVSEALATIYGMHTEESLDRIRNLRKEVKEIEEQGDDIKEDMLNYAYSAKLDFKSFYHIQNLAYLSDDILDSCEDAADMIMNIMFSVVS